MVSKHEEMQRVTRSKEAARVSYNRLSKWYDFIAGTSEWKFVKIGLDLFQAAPGEKILEVGFGTGRGVKTMAQAVGAAGKVYGIDLSPGMYQVAQDRIDRSGLDTRVELHCGDAVQLPYADNFFDGVFSSFTLDLFDTPEIPMVLNECHRVLKPGQRLVVVSLVRKPTSFAVRLYEWAHDKFPNYVDCRPIYLSSALQAANFHLVETKTLQMWGLPVAAALAQKN